MQNFMFKCSKLTSNLKKNHYLMLKMSKNWFIRFLYSKSVCVTVLNWFFISPNEYCMYNKNKNGYQLSIINMRTSNTSWVKFLKFYLQRLPLMNTSRTLCYYPSGKTSKNVTPSTTNSSIIVYIFDVDLRKIRNRKFWLNPSKNDD